MTQAQITERLNKANEKITKKQGTITKKQALIEKKTASLAKASDEYEIRSLNFDIKYLKEDIARLEKEIPEIRKTVEKYEKQLAGEIEKEALLTKTMPEEFRTLKNTLVERWDAFDLERKEFFRKKSNEMEYREFIRQYKYSAYQLAWHTSTEEIHKQNEKDAEHFIIDLYNRVKDITGEVTNWEGIRLTMGNNFPVLEGMVQGKEGKARVETILAGGYNIQRLHIRTLVHSI
jgi:chromosome segregation ATPase